MVVDKTSLNKPSPIRSLRNHLYRIVQFARKLRFQIFRDNGDSKFEELYSQIESFQTALLYTHSAAMMRGLDNAPGEYGEHMNLVVLLSMTMFQLASDPRDKVYALLGIALDIDELDITIDYTLSIRKVYIATTKALLNEDLHILLLIGSPNLQIEVGEKDGFPSWVPNFETRQSFTAIYFSMSSEMFTAAQANSLDVRFDEGDVLVLKAVYVAVVVEVLPVQIIIGLEKEPMDQLSLFKYDRDPRKRYKSLAKDKSKMGSRNQRRRRKGKNLRNSNWGPGVMEVGDIIIVAKGSPVPLVLRNVKVYISLLVDAGLLMESWPRILWKPKTSIQVSQAL